MILPDIEITAPRLGVQQVVRQEPLAPAVAAVEGMADILVKKQERDADAYEIKTNPDLYIGMRQAMEQARVEAKDPDKITELFFTKAKSIYDPIYSSAPNEAAKKRIEAKYSGLKASLGSQAIALQAEEMAKTRTMDVDSSNNQANAYIMQTGDYEGGLKIIADNVTKMDSFTSPSEKQKIQEQAFAAAAQSKLDHAFENGDLNQVTELLKDSNFNKYLSPEVQAKYYKAIDTQNKKIELMKYENPAAWAVTQGATDVNSVVEAQSQIGIPPSKASVIRNEDAKQEVARISNIADPVEMTNYLNELEDNYKEYTPNAINDLIKQDLPPEYSYILNLTSGDEFYDAKTENAEHVKLMFEMVNGRNKKQKEGGKDLVELSKSYLATDGNIVSRTSEDGFEKQFNSQFDEVSRMYQAEQLPLPVINDIRQQTLNMAYAAYTKKRDVTKSIEFAMKPLLNSHQRIYNKNTLNGMDVPIRVPLGLDAAAIEAGLDIAIQLPVKTFDENKELQVYKGEKVKQSAAWVINDDNTGLRLVNENYEPLLNEKDEPVEYSFTQLEAVGQTYQDKKKEISFSPFGKSPRAQMEKITKDLQQEIRPAQIKRKAKKGTIQAPDMIDSPVPRNPVGG